MLLPRKIKMQCLKECMMIPETVCNVTTDMNSMLGNVFKPGNTAHTNATSKPSTGYMYLPQATVSALFND
jgi:hypothetical protein